MSFKHISRARIVCLATVVVSQLFFAASLFEIGFEVENAKAFEGLNLLLLGWLGLMADKAWPWLANPVLIGAWFTLLLRLANSSLIASILAVVLILSFLWFDQVMVDEGMSQRKIIHIGRGYWLWLTSAVIALLGSAAFFWVSRNRPDVEQARRQTY